MKQEPVIFNYKAEDDETVPSSLRELSTITLLINPDRLDLNWRKVITRTRTKSRIVSLFWGQEPVNFSYTGQTGNMYPSRELATKIGQINSANKEQASLLQSDQDEANEALDQLNSDLANPNIDEDTRASLEIDRDLEEAEIANTQAGIEGASPADPSDLTQTDLYELSPKYQRFKSLQQLFENSRNIKDLMKVKYRDYIFEGYFESFGYIDDGRNPWNRSYRLSFIILGWSKPFTPSTNEIMLVEE